MKKITPLLISLSIAAAVPAQDWSPFVPGQVSYFQPVDNDSLVFRRQVMAEYDRGTHTTLYFHNGFHDSCTAEQVDDTPSDLWGGWWPDSVMVYPDRFEYNTLNMNGIFYHDIAPGQSFAMNCQHCQQNPASADDEWQITLDSAGMLSFAGVTDSVKHFSVQYTRQGQPITHPYNGEHIVLSKHYGLVRFLGDFSLSADMMSYHLDAPLSLISVSNDTLPGQLYLPTKDDWLVWQPGNVLMWYSYQTNFSFVFSYHFRDSIISIVRTDTFFTYTFHREKMDLATRQISYESNLTQTYNLYELAGNSTANFGMPFIPYGAVLYGHDLPVQTQTTAEGDTIAGYTQEIFGYYSMYGLPSSGCAVGQMVDANLYTRYHYRKGLVYSAYYAFTGQSILELIGYRTATDTVGNTWPLSVDNPKTPLPLSLYPNPASTLVQLSLPEDAAATGIVTLLDITGRTVLQQPLNGQLRINISDLPAGWYAVHVFVDGVAWHGKLLK